MTGKEVEKYIMGDLGCEPRHDCEALAAAITEMAKELEKRRDGKYTTGLELMELLLDNIDAPIVKSYILNSIAFNSYSSPENLFLTTAPSSYSSPLNHLGNCCFAFNLAFIFIIFFF